jgi:tetratricopeptide (TPR) repeat protein
LKPVPRSSPSAVREDRRDNDLLPQQAEAEWQRLRRQLDLARGFWLGFLFTGSPPLASVFRQRVEDVLRSRTQVLEAFQASSPEELRGYIPRLFDTKADCIWFEALAVDPITDPNAPPGPWLRAWGDLLLRVNERRDLLRRSLRGGLVFVAPVPLKPVAREAAPDLWSVQSIVLERAIRLRSGQYDRTWLAAFEALIEMAQATGDSATARSAAEEMLALARTLVPATSPTPQALRDLAVSLNEVGDVRRDQGDLAAAAAAFDESLQIDRKLIDLYGESPQDLRDLADSLEKVRSSAAEGDPARAEQLAAELAEVRRKLAAARGSGA